VRTSVSEYTTRSHFCFAVDRPFATLSSPVWTQIMIIACKHYLSDSTLHLSALKFISLLIMEVGLMQHGILRFPYFISCWFRICCNAEQWAPLRCSERDSTHLTFLLKWGKSSWRNRKLPHEIPPHFRKWTMSYSHLIRYAFCLVRSTAGSKSRTAKWGFHEIWYWEALTQIV
jgi:hypothetical protein